jgi:hypothetical protein
MQNFRISAPGSGVPLTALDNIIPFAGKREGGRDVCSCAGFRMPAMIDGATYTLAGVRKPPRNEPAGGGGRRRRGLGYGDLADAEGVRERARCAVARAITRQAGNSSWD